MSVRQSAEETLTSIFFDLIKLGDQWEITERDMDIIYNSVMDFIENDMSKHGSKAFSKKMKLRLNAKRFQLNLKDDVYFYYSVNWGKKLKHDVYDVYKTMILKTQMGRVYVVPVCGVLFCFVAHFFDRMKQRNEELSEKTRREMIDHHIRELKKAKIYITKESPAISIFSKSGVSLGIGAWLKNVEAPYFVIKTFLSNDMLTEEHFLLEKKAVPLEFSLKRTPPDEENEEDEEEEELEREDNLYEHFKIRNIGKE